MWLRAATAGGLVSVVLLAKWMLFVPPRYESQVVLPVASLRTGAEPEALAVLEAMTLELAARQAPVNDLELSVLGLAGQVAVVCRAPTAKGAYQLCLELAEQTTRANLVLQGGSPVPSSPRLLALAHPWGVWLTSCAAGGLAALFVALGAGILTDKPVRPAQPGSAESSPTTRAATASMQAEETLQQLRALRDQLYLLAADKCLVVGVSSGPAQHDRKAFVAAQLATILSESDQVKVLLLEADFERPSLHQVLGVSVQARAGFSQQIYQRLRTGTEVPWVVIRRSPSLSLLAEGLMRIPSTLSSAQFPLAMAQLRELYDIIVVNGPVAGRGADAREFAQIADVMIFALEAGRDAGDAVRLAAKRFKNKRVAAVVLAPETNKT